jgi:hypothetical protein
MIPPRDENDNGRERIFTNHVSYKRLVSMMYKKLLQRNNKNENDPIKNRKMT